MSRRRCCEDLEDLLAPELFKALCDPTRLALLCGLAETGTPSTVSDAAGCCAVDLSVVSRHLAQLRDAGVLSAERRGREVYYSVRARELAQCLRAIAGALEACRPKGKRK